MNLTLTDEQRQLRESYARLFERECSIDVVRQAEAEGGWSPQLWRRLADGGITTLGLSEALGGQGAGLLECGMVLEEAGRRLAPVPIIEAVTVARLVAHLGPGGYPVLVDARPEQVTTVAPGPADGGWWRLVPWGACADAMIGQDGERLVCVQRNGPPRRLTDIGGGASADWHAHDQQTSVVELSSGPEAVRLGELIAAERSALAAAWLTGCAAGALDLAVGYTSHRQAFGIPVASFQTVAHRLADMATAVDGARLLTQEAAWYLDESHPKGLGLSSMALVFASTTAVDAAGLCVHLHGGYGFMLEYDPQLYYRRAMAQSLIYGAPGQIETLSMRLFGRGE